MAGEIEARLKALDLALPEAKAALGSYVPFLHLDRLLFISGQLPDEGRQGRVHRQARRRCRSYATARRPRGFARFNILAQAKTALRDLDRIVQLLRLNGFVNAAPDFADHPKVLNGASDFLVESSRQQGAPYPHRRRLLEPATWRLRRGRCDLRRGLTAMAERPTCPELYWLKRPIAHRGLHDAAKGIVENSASAVAAAMGKGYAIEVDLQCAARSCAGCLP